MTDGPDAPRVAVSLTGVQETLLIPLAARVGEARRPGSDYRDPMAEAIAVRLDVDLRRFAREWTNMAAVVGRTAIVDREVAAFLAEHRGAQVVNLACGLCTRFHRLDDGAVRWLGVDLPDVIALARQLLPESDRFRLLAADALSDAWMAGLDRQAPTLFVIEGLLMYLSQAQVQQLLTGLGRAFPNATVLLEAISPLVLRTIGRISPSVRSTGATFDWGLSDPTELEALVPGLEVSGVWLHTEVHPEQWRWLRIFRYFPPIHGALKVIRAGYGALPSGQ